MESVPNMEDIRSQAEIERELDSFSFRHGQRYLVERVDPKPGEEPEEEWDCLGVEVDDKGVPKPDGEVQFEVTRISRDPEGKPLRKESGEIMTHREVITVAEPETLRTMARYHLKRRREQLAADELAEGLKEEGLL